MPLHPTEFLGCPRCQKQVQAFPALYFYKCKEHPKCKMKRVQLFCSECQAYLESREEHQGQEGQPDAADKKQVPWKEK